MGGGTGTGAAPIIADAARKMNILTVGMVTTPFLFEGKRRMDSAQLGIADLEKGKKGGKIEFIIDSGRYTYCGSKPKVIEFWGTERNDAKFIQISG
jgi:hypothetical protein